MHCPCTNPDPQTACTSISKLPITKTLRDDSHLIITLRHCPTCNRHWLIIFTELIDWSGGDDSQARLYIPLSPTEVTILPDPLPETAILSLKPRRHAIMAYPRGGQKTFHWLEGEITIPPHD